MDNKVGDNVQNTIKNLQDKIQNIESLIDRGNDCVIIQYGSHSIKMNKAHENLPKKLRNLIAYRCENPVGVAKPVIPAFDTTQIDEKAARLEDKLMTKGFIKSQPKSMRGKPRAKIEVDVRNIKPFQMKREKQNLKDCPLRELIENRKFVFEDEIYLVEERPDYIVRQPIRHGFFNLTGNYSQQDVIEDLHNLTIYGLTTKLDISMKQIPDLYCILVVPDIFQRIQIKALVDMLIRQIGFKGIYLHLESVLASFGANLSTCCVVDIGYEKINVTCVDDGVVLPGTYVRKNFGSRDIDLVLLRQIVKRNATDNTLQLSQQLYGDMQQMERLKEKSCQLQQKEDKLNYLYELHCVREGKEKKFLVQHNDGLYLAPNALLDGDVFNRLRVSNQKSEAFDFTSRLFEMQYDPEDNLEEFSGGIQLSWYWGSKEKEVQYFQSQTAMLDPEVMIPLDQMIVYAISQVQDSEMRQKLANNILFVGGGTTLLDLVEEVEGLLIERFQEWEIQEVERVEVRTVIREVRPIHTQWVGATVLPKTESMNECWITAPRWLGNLELQKDEMEEIMNSMEGDVDFVVLEKKVQAYSSKKDKEKDRSAEYGIKHLKEKIAFIW